MSKDTIVTLHCAVVGDDATVGPATSVPGLLASLVRAGGKAALLVTAPHSRFDVKVPFPVFHAADCGKRDIFDWVSSSFDRPNLTIFHGAYIPRHARIAKLSRNLGIPYVVTPRGGLNQFALRQKWLKKRVGNLLFFSKFIRNSSALHCLTPNEELQVKCWRRPTFVVPNGVEIPQRKLEGPSLDRTAWGWDNDDIVFLFLGRLHMKIKGLDLLFRGFSLAQLQLSRNKARLLLVGPDSERNKVDLVRLAAKLGITKSVVFAGTMTGSERDAVFRSADIFVHTSRTEGLPSAVLEALSWGMPCILTRATNLAEQVLDAGAGWCCDCSAGSICNAIIDATLNRHLLRTKANSARKLVANNYSWDIIAKRMLAHYEAILNGYQKRNS